MSITKTIIAKAKGKVCGQKDMEWPENLKEAIKMDGEEKVFSLYSQQKAVTERAALYPKVASAGSVSRKSVYEKMIAANVDAATAAQVSGYTPEG